LYTVPSTIEFTLTGMGEAEVDGENEVDGVMDGEREMLGLTDGEREMLGVAEGVREVEGVMLGDTETLAETDGEGSPEGGTDAEALTEGSPAGETEGSELGKLRGAKNENTDPFTLAETCRSLSYVQRIGNAPVAGNNARVPAPVTLTRKTSPVAPTTTWFPFRRQ
jgi:hypothetical protein